MFFSGRDAFMRGYIGKCQNVDLLSNSAMNISQIAEYLGYSSVYYFSRLFKRRCGVSPISYFEKR